MRAGGCEPLQIPPLERSEIGGRWQNGGVTQTNKADKRSQRQAVTAFLYYYHTPLLHRITSQTRTIPCFAPPHLPPLSKVRCCRPKKFGRLPEGLSLHQPFQNRTIPCFAPPHLPPLLKVRCCRPKKFGRLPEGLLHQPSQNRTIPRKSTISFHNPTFSAHS